MKVFFGLKTWAIITTGKQSGLFPTKCSLKIMFKLAKQEIYSLPFLSAAAVLSELFHFQTCRHVFCSIQREVSAHTWVYFSVVIQAHWPCRQTFFLFLVNVSKNRFRHLTDHCLHWKFWEMNHCSWLAAPTGEEESLSRSNPIPSTKQQLGCFC